MYLLCCRKKKKQNPPSKIATELTVSDMDQVETENLLVYKLQGGNEVNQVKKRRKIFSQ